MTLARDGHYGSEVVPHRLGPFVDGVRYDEVHELVPVTGVAEMQNIEIGSGGEALKRRGYERLVDTNINDLSGTGVGLIRFSAASSAQFYTVNGEFYGKIPSASEWTDRSGSTVTISDDPDDFLVWVDAFGTGFFADGVNAPFKWTSETSDIELAGVSSRFAHARGVTWFADRLWWWNTDNSEGEIWFSNLVDREEIEANSFFDVRAVITAVSSFRGKLYVHTDLQIWVIERTGNAQIPFRIDQHIPFGAVSPRSVVSLPDGRQIIGRQDGFYSWVGGSYPVKISKALEERYWKRVDQSKRHLWGMLVDVVRSQVWCFLTTAKSELDEQATINHVMIYDYQYNRWFGPHTIAMTSWAYVNQDILTTGYEDGLVYVQQTGLNDDTTRIQASISTSAASPVGESQTTEWMNGKAFFQGQNIETDLSITQAGPEVGYRRSRRRISSEYDSIGSFIIGRSAIGSDRNLRSVDFDARGKGFSSRVDVENDLLNQSFNLQFIDLLYRPLGYKKGGQRG